MSMTMKQKKINELAQELAKDIKTPEDLAAFSAQLTKLTVEAALSAEMQEHLGYARHQSSQDGSANTRNGYSSKTIKGDHGEITLDIPRDREASFDPQIVRKGQTRITGMDDQILCFYAKGMSTRDISETFLELYGTHVSAGLVSKVTNAVMDQVIEWQNRPLEAVYPIIYLDCIVIKIRQDRQVINKSVYLALGINLEGHKELLGLWIAETEGAKFWLHVLTELKNRGVKQPLIFCVDGLKGFPEAINSAFPEARVQLCIIHLVRYSLRFVSWKDAREVAADLKRIYQSITEQEAALELDKFAEKWNSKYPQIAKSWSANWLNLITLFDFPDDIRRVIYTTNAIESLNSVIRKSVKTRKLFPSDESATKVIFLAIQAASKNWTMPVRKWKAAMNHFMIKFDEQLAPYL